MKNYGFVLGELVNITCEDDNGKLRTEEWELLEVTDGGLLVVTDGGQNKIFNPHSRGFLSVEPGRSWQERRAGEREFADALERALEPSELPVD
jgi:hypothetical protein